MILINLAIFIGIFGIGVCAIKNKDIVAKIERRQSQGFFPAVDSSGFVPSNSDIYFNDDTNNLNDQGFKFSSNLREDLYQANAPQQQQQYSPQQYQLQQKPVKNYQQNDAYFNSGEYSPLVQQQYNPNVQQQYSPQSQQYFGSQSYSQLGPSYPVGASIQFGNPQFNVPSSSTPPFKNRRPTYSLYPPNSVRPYGSVQPGYQSQQNYPVDPNAYGDSGNGIADSVANFFTNIGQGAANLLGGGNPAQSSGPPGSFATPPGNFGPSAAGPPSGNFALLGGSAPPGGSFRPPVNGYRPPAQGSFQTNQFLGRPSTPSNAPVNQFARAIEEITRNDDFQCIPKVLCQMVGSQRRQPTFLNSPIFSALISAVPSTSASLVYGRAALLGLSSGEHSCHTAYPKCPRNEDDLLFYLNNHRGGFFRFFNGGTAFGDDSQYQYKPNPYTYNPSQNQQQQQSYQQSYRPQQQPPQPQQQPSSLASNLAVFQGLADAINQGGGINLSNLGGNSDLLGNLASLVGGAGDLNSLASNSGILGNLADLVGGGRPAATTTTTTPAPSAASISDLVGNLLTGFVGNRFTSRKISKRSIVSFPDDERHKNLNELFADSKSKGEKKKTKATKVKSNAFDDIEARIVNKRPIYSDQREPSHDQDDNRDQENVHFDGPENNRDYNRYNVNNNRYKDDNNKYNDDNNRYNDDNNRYNDENNGYNNDNIRYNDDGNRYNDDSNRYNNDDNNRYNSNNNRYNDDNNRYNDNNNGYNDDNNNNNRYNDDSNRYNDNNNNDVFRIPSSNRSPKTVNFRQENQQNSNSNKNRDQFFPDNNDHNKPSYSQSNRPSKMIFPIRTGTGNLKFDNEEFDRPGQNRYGKILTGGNRYHSQSPSDHSNGNRVSFGNNNRYQSNGQEEYNRDQQRYDRDQQQPNRYRPYQDNNTNRYVNQNHNNNNNYNSQNNRYTGSSSTPSYNRYTSGNRGNGNSSSNRDQNSSHNIYVTNSKGVIEYYINAEGKKVYV